MPTRHWLLTILMFAVSSLVVAHEPPKVTVDHTSGAVTYQGYGLTIPISDDGETIVPLRHGDKLTVTIVATNTLAYAYDKKIEAIDLETKKALFSYLGTLNPALVALAKVATPASATDRSRFGKGLEDAIGRVEEAQTEARETIADFSAVLSDLETLGHAAAKLDAMVLDAIQLAENGKQPIISTSALRWASVPKSRKLPGCDWNVSASDAATLAAQLSSNAQLTLACYERARENVFAAEAALRLAIADLGKQISQETFEDVLEANAASGGETKQARIDSLRSDARDEFLADPQAMLKELEALSKTLPPEVFELPRLFLRLQQRFEGLGQRKTEHVVATVGYRWDKLQKVTIDAKAKEALAGRLAFTSRSFETVTFSVSPEWILQPSVGAGFVYAGNLEFPTFALEGEGAEKTIVESGREDKRFQFFPVLSLAPRPLSRLGSWYAQANEKPMSGKAVTIDLGWNVKDDDAAYLAGASVVLARQFKVGAGVIWQKRKVLDGVAVGASGEDVTLKTRESYPPEIYFMISILGWPPFTSGGD